MLIHLHMDRDVICAITNESVLSRRRALDSNQFTQLPSPETNEIVTAHTMELFRATLKKHITVGRLKYKTRLQLITKMKKWLYRALFKGIINYWLAASLAASLAT